MAVDPFIELSARLGLDRAISTVATLEAIGLPAAALAPSGRVVSTNAGFLVSESRVRVGAGNMIQFASEPAQALLMEAISGAARSRTASQITEGKSIEQISTATGIAQNTIRTHLKSVFQKAGVQRQAELVSLLGVAINQVV